MGRVGQGRVRRVPKTELRFVDGWDVVDCEIYFSIFFSYLLLC